MLLWLFNYNDRIYERGRKGLSRGEFSPRGMEPPKPGGMPRRRRRVILVIAVSAIVVVAGFLVWDVFVRPRSLAEVYGFDHWSPGSTVTVVGKITSIERQNTSYGPEVYLGLDGGPGCAGVPSVVGDPTAKYEIGARFQTTLHFQRYTINGDPPGSAPQLQCPFPLILRGIGSVLRRGPQRTRGRRRPVGRQPGRYGLADHMGHVSAHHRRILRGAGDLRILHTFHPGGSDGTSRCPFARETRRACEAALRRRHLRDDVHIEDRRALRIRTRPCDFGRPLLRGSRRLIWERDPLRPPDHPEQRSLARPHGCEWKRSARLRRRVPRRRPGESDLGDLEFGPQQCERGNPLLGRRLRRANRAGSGAHVHHPGDEPVARDRELFVLESRTRHEPDLACVSPGEWNRGVDGRLPRKRDSRDVRERHPRARRLGWRRKSFHRGRLHGDRRQRQPVRVGHLRALRIPVASHLLNRGTPFAIRRLPAEG